MNKLKTIAITLGCTAVATATVAAFGAKPLLFQPAQATEKTFLYDKTVGGTWKDGAEFVYQERNVPTGQGDPITTTVNGQTGSNTGGFGGDNFFETASNLGLKGPITIEAGLNNVTRFACEFHFAFDKDLASSNKPGFDISIVATDGVHNSELNGSVSLVEFDQAYFYEWTKKDEDAPYVFTQITMTLTPHINSSDAYFVGFFHYAEVTWNC